MTQKKGIGASNIDFKLRLLRSYINILETSKGDSVNYEIARTYFIILHNFLIIEDMFSEDIKGTGKEINRYLDLTPLGTIEEVMELFLILYNRYHNVRFAVETLDSIESIRIFLQKNPFRYHLL